MSLLLACEASSRHGSVAVLDGPRLVAEVEATVSTGHGEELLPLVERALADAGVRPVELDAVAVGTGPGSFTGLRVAVATALGLARGAGLGVVPVSSLEALAAGAAPAPGERVVALVDALRDEAFALFPGEPEARLVALADVARELVARALGRVLVVGDVGARPTLALPPGGARLAPPAVPRARDVGRLAAGRPRHAPSALAALEPRYVRAPSIG